MYEIAGGRAATWPGARPQQGSPAHSGDCFFASPAIPDMKSAYQFGFVEAPETSDQVAEAEAEAEGAPPVFVAPEVADSLENTVLDTEEGRLVLTPQNK